MNKRIKELIKSCGIIPEDEHYEVAELIVKECYLWAKENGGISDDADYDALKQHLGVE